MGGFATNGINMTKLESYQLGGKFFATLFYADVEGHPDDHNLKLALEELEFFSAEFRIVGVYPASPFRKNIAEPAENRDNRPQAPKLGSCPMDDTACSSARGKTSLVDCDVRSWWRHAAHPPFVETQRRRRAPQSTLDAVIGERQTDATVATPTEVFVVKAGEAVAGEPIFRADHVSDLW